MKPSFYHCIAVLISASFVVGYLLSGYEPPLPTITPVSQTKTEKSEKKPRPVTDIHFYNPDAQGPGATPFLSIFFYEPEAGADAKIDQLESELRSRLKFATAIVTENDYINRVDPVIREYHQRFKECNVGQVWIDCPLIKRQMHPYQKGE